MSEHPELLRDPIVNALSRAGLDISIAADVADALLAGPVGKLQAELAEAQQQIARLTERIADWQRRFYEIVQHRFHAEREVARLTTERSDPERIRREAIGAAVLGHTIGRVGHVELQDGTMWWKPVDRFVAHLLAAGESAVTGEAT